MKRVTGIGGIFFQARDPVSLRAEECNVLEEIETEQGQ